MLPLVLLIHPDPPWSTFSVKFEKVWIRVDQSGPGGPQGPQPPLVDQERSGPPWTTLQHFPDVAIRYKTHNEDQDIRDTVPQEYHHLLDVFEKGEQTTGSPH